MRSPRVIRPYHRRLYRAITRWAAGRLPNEKLHLAITIPPRHGKTLAAHDSIEWLFGMYPDSKWIYTSYTAKLAFDQTEKIRDDLCSEWYQRMFPSLKMDSMKQNHITTTEGGELYAAGMTGTLTGFGAGLKRPGFGGAIIIDDPLSADDARSETVRNHVNEWYTQTLKSRRNHDKTPILLIMQRLHMDDLAGYIMQTEPELWHFINLPALNEATGEMLWPETFSRESAEKMRAIDPMTFYAQYQQEPIIPGGAMLRTEWWQWFELDYRYKFNGLLFATADTAYKAKSTADASVIRIWHGTSKYLDCVDCVYGRWEFPELLRRAQDIFRKWKDYGLRQFFIEDKATGTPLEQTLRSQGVPAYGWRPADYDFPDDKVSRVQESAWVVAGGHVRLPAGTTHSQVLIDEAARFMPDMSHAHDDHVDTLTMAVSIWRYAGGKVYEPVTN